MRILAYSAIFRCMVRRHILHIIDGSSRDRAAQSYLGFEMGFHCEVYTDINELLAISPESGIIMARDGEEENCITQLMDKLAIAGIWLPVIATSTDPSPRKVVAAVKSGALEYLSLPLEKERLSQVILYIADEMEAYGTARRKMIEARNRLATLSPREHEVLKWLTEGCSNKVIARELAISPRTVEIHRANMMTKLGAHHAADAVRLRIEAHLDDLDAK